MVLRLNADTDCTLRPCNTVTPETPGKYKTYKRGVFACSESDAVHRLPRKCFYHGFTTETFLRFFVVQKHRKHCIFVQKISSYGAFQLENSVTARVSWSAREDLNFRPLPPQGSKMDIFGYLRKMQTLKTGVFNYFVFAIVRPFLVTCFWYRFGTGL